MPATYDELVRQLTMLRRRVDDLVLPERSPDLISPLLALPVLRGAWVASVDAGGHWYDLGGLGKTLTYNGNPMFNYDGLVPYWDLDGAGDFFTRGDEADLDILGTETTVATAVRGLTLGGWFWFDTTANHVGMIGKWTPYLLQHFAATGVRFVVHDGALQHNTPAISVAANTWVFCAGRYTPSTEIKVWVNSATDTLAAGIPAALPNTANEFAVGRLSGGGQEMDGRSSCCFLCAAALSDAQISSLFNQTRAAFGV